MFIPDQDRQIKMPSLKFNRRIGMYARQFWTVEGEPIDESKYAAYLSTVLPRAEDIQFVKDLEKEPNWIEPKKADSLA